MVERRSPISEPSPTPDPSAAVLTFLIADVRGYTSFTVEQGDEAAARLASRFSELAESIVKEHGGRVVELRGDEAMAVFSSTRNALRAAVALQTGFKNATDADPSLPLRVGIGLDAGEAVPVGEGYRGGALNLAARLCSIASAGEIFASAGVTHLARKTGGIAFADRGEVRLKGLAGPVRVVQIVAEGEVPAALPPLQPPPVIRSTNLSRLLRRHRLAAGLTQEQLAEAAGVSARSIGDLERGLQRTPYPGTIRRLTDALDLDAEARAAFLDAALETPPAAVKDAETTAPSLSSPSSALPRTRSALRLPRRRLVLPLVAVVLLVPVAIILELSRSTSHGPPLGTFVRSLAVSGPSVVGRPTSVALGSDGTVYVLDQSAGAIRVYSARGRLLTAWGSAGSRPSQMWEPGGLALGPSHDIYVADTGNGRIEKFNGSGRLLADWTQQYGAPGTFRPVSIAVDRSGIVYVADAGHFRVLRLDPSGHLLDALPPPSVPGQFPIPVLSSVSIGPTGRIYVADGKNDYVTVYEAGGVPTSTLIHTAAHPASVASDRRGDIYVTYRGAGAVQEISPDDVPLHTWRDNGLRTPDGITLGSSGDLYLADPGSGDVSRLVHQRWVPLIRSGSQAGAAGTAVRIAAGPTGSIALADARSGRITWLNRGSGQPAEILLGRSRPARFIGPIGGLAAAADGTLYVADSGGGDVLKLAADGQFAGVWGSSPPALAHPEGVAIDRAGNVYVADEGNGRVQEFFSGGRLDSIFPIPQPQSAGLVGPSPFGVAVDSAEDLYVTDEINDHVFKLDRNYRIIFQWGTQGSGPSGLRAPQGIALDEKHGRIYVADNGNNRIQVLNTAGRLLGAIRVDRPQDVAVDPTGGRVYILDDGGTRVQILAP
jgi:DNA-binding beta-propeller fold protein YncE/class 3 adenylate cyclase/DNA-binding XRE family transcriptional regulator